MEHEFQSTASEEAVKRALTNKELGFGEKTITFWGSFVLNINNCMGPAMVLLPLVNQTAGWLTPTISLIVVFITSSFACTMLCEAAQRIPGNRNYEMQYDGGRFEFCSLVKYYYGDTAYLWASIAFNASLQASNIAAMIVTAQVLDNFVQKAAGATYAFNWTTFHFVASGSNPLEPWGDGVWTVISLGFVIALIICIPFGFMNLEENMWFQWLSFAGLMIFTLEFAIQFIVNIADPPTEDGSLPAGNGVHLTPAFRGAGQANVLGIMVFAYAYVLTIPSWVNEKKRGVEVNAAVWWPATLGLCMKLVIGLLGSLAYPLVDSNGVPFSNRSSNILNVLAAGGGSTMAQISIYSSYLWNVLTLIPGIPVLAIMIKYNLVSGKVCSPFWANFFGVVLPWIVTAFCYEAGVLNTLCNWVAILIQGYVNFVVPILLYRKAIIMFPKKDDGKAETCYKLGPGTRDEGIRRAMSMPRHRLESDDVHPSHNQHRMPSAVDLDNMMGTTPNASLLADHYAGDGCAAQGTPTKISNGGSSFADGDTAPDEGGPSDEESSAAEAARLLADVERGPEHVGRDAFGGSLQRAVSVFGAKETRVDAVPKFLREFMSPVLFADIIGWFFFLLCTATVVFNIVGLFVNASS